MNSNKRTVLILFCYIAVYIVWGSTYFFIKLAVDTIHPFALLAVRFIFGGVLLLGIAAATGNLWRLPRLREIAGSVILGSLLLIGGNGFITVSEMHTDSSFAALIVSAAPVFVAFFDRVIFRKKISVIKLIGVLVGFLGVVFLFYNEKSLFGSFSPPVLLACAGVLIFSFGMSIRHKLTTPHTAIVNTGIQMLFVGIAALIVSLICLPSIPEMLISASFPSLMSLVFLSVIGTVTFVAFNYLLREEPSLRVSSYALVNPLIASAIGIFIAGDKPVKFFFISLPLILVGIAFMLYGDRLKHLVKTRFFADKEER